MKTDKEKLSIAQIAQAIGMSEQIVRNWVLWYEQSYPDVGNLYLPTCTWVEHGSKLYRAFDKKDVEAFKKFKEDRIKRWGVMRDYNAERNWGKYGKALLKNKNRRKCYAKKEDSKRETATETEQP